MIDEACRAAIIFGSRGSGIPEVRVRAESPIVDERPRGLTQSLE